jgi:hypothetical protein
VISLIWMVLLTGIFGVGAEQRAARCRFDSREFAGELASWQPAGTTKCAGPAYPLTPLARTPGRLQSGSSLWHRALW